MVSSGDNRNTGPKGDGRAMEAGKEQPRPGLPRKSSILSERTFVSPQNRQYRIITTSERDPYDEPDPAAKRQDL